MAYKINNQRVFKSEILPKWKTEILNSQFAVGGVGVGMGVGLEVGGEFISYSYILCSPS